MRRKVANPADQWAAAAAAATAAVGPVRILTTEEVLAEFLNSYGRSSLTVRRQAARIVRTILADPGVTVVAQSHQSFLTGLNLREHRLDQGCSFTDCASMICMRSRKIAEALTSDRHFVAEGFSALLSQ